MTGEYFAPMRIFRLAIALCALFAALFAADTARAEGTRIAVVNLQQAVMNTEDGLRASSTIKKLFEQRTQDLKKKQDDIEKESIELEKKSKVLSKDAYQKAREELQKKAMDYQQQAVDYSKELDKKQKELTDPIVNKMLAIVKRTATTENFDMVIDSSPTNPGIPWGAVAYSRSDLDLTDKCIQMYNTSGASGLPPAASTSANPPKK